MVKTEKDSSYSIEHCIQRYKERYGKNLTIEEYTKLNKRTQNWFKYPTDEFKEVSKDKISEDNYSYILAYTFNDELTYLVYETKRNCITTFLPVKSVMERIKKNKTNGKKDKN
jgi:hypothetical protein